MTAPDMITVEVWYASAPHVLRQRTLQLPVGSTVADAVRASALLEGLAPEAQDALVTAVWGKVKEPATTLRERDRVELLRALKVDPKEARRQRYRRDGVKKAPRRTG